MVVRRVSGYNGCTYRLPGTAVSVRGASIVRHTVVVDGKVVVGARSIGVPRLPPPIPVPNAHPPAGDITGRNDIPESTIGGETTCIVCVVHPKAHLAVPCGHQSACRICAERMQNCPYCRAPVQQWVELRVV